MSPESPAPSFPTSWRTVSFGTVCLSAGAVVLLLGVLAFSVVIAMNTQLWNAPTVEGISNRARHVPPLTVVGCLLVLFTGTMMWLAGLCLFCVVPVDSGARPVAWAAVISWFLFLVTMLQVPMTSLGIRVPGPRFGNERHEERDGHRMIYGSEAGFGLAGGMFAVAGGGFTMAFVCAVAHRFKNDKLARSAQRFLLYQIVALPVLLMVLVAHNYVTDSQGGRQLEWYVGLLPFAIPIVGIPVVGCIWLLRVLSEMRRMLRTAEEIAMEQENAPAPAL